VVKSAGSETELLILTAEQRKRTAELAEKFDTAALVYNITSLEKLRWTIKNTDAPRPLLDALLVRFALSEHFLDVDRLLANLAGGAEGVIKKKLTRLPQGDDADFKTARKPTESVKSKEADLPVLENLQAIKDNWQDILRVIGTGIGAGTAALLRSLAPSRYAQGVLTLAVPASAELSTKMLTGNGRLKQVQSLLSKYCRGLVTIRIETRSDEPAVSPAPAGRPGAGGKKRSELINDPAVKTVILGLDATITRIEENA
jgi:hypothetical protein